MPQAGLLFRVFFFVLLPSECFWKRFESLFGPKACLGMVRGGLWGKECAPKSFQWPVRDRKSSILNKGHFPGIAPELIKIDVLAICVQSEVVKPEILNTGQNGAPGVHEGSRSAPGVLFGCPEVTQRARVAIPEGFGVVLGGSKNSPGAFF